MGADFYKKNTGKINEVFNALVGPAELFSLEHRIYNTFCFIAALAVTYNIPFNYYLELYSTTLLTILLAIVIGVAFYLSRIKRRLQLSFILSAVTVNIIFAANFFINAGMHGPSLLLMAISYYCIIAAAPRSQYWVWTFLNLGIVGGLAVYEFFFPDNITGSYPTRESFFLDMLSTYIIMIVMLRVCTGFLIRSYNRARVSAEEANKALQLLDQEKNKLFSIVSHDLRAPLASIQDYLALLVKLELPTEKRRELETGLLEVTKGTLDMLTNILSWSRGQLEGGIPDLKPLPVQRMLSPVLSLYSEIANGKNITLENAVDVEVEVLGDSEMLQLVIRNLINNAIKFTSPGGSVTVGAAQLHGYCLLKVTDSGNGLPLNLQPAIFQLQGEPTFGTQQEKGVGLGLVLCREFVEAMGGKIWCESHPSSGATFFVQLPVAAKAPVAAVELQLVERV